MRNSGGWKNQQAEVSTRLKEKEIDAVIIIEVKLVENDNVRISGYDVVKKVREWSKGRGTD